MRKQRVQGSNFLDKRMLFVVVVLLAAAVLIGRDGNVTTTGLASKDYKLGDANLDGRIDALDLRIFLDVKKGIVPLNKQCMDVNKDSIVDENDYEVFLTKIFVGKQALGPC